MALLRYTGPMDVRPLWGVDFPRGETVEVQDPELIAKALRLDHFERVNGDVAEVTQSMSSNDGADEASEEWRSLHWKRRVVLAKQLSGREDIRTPQEADEVLEQLWDEGET